MDIAANQPEPLHQTVVGICYNSWYYLNTLTTVPLSLLGPLILKLMYQVILVSNL